jgi:hypothetical protein
MPPVVAALTSSKDLPTYTVWKMLPWPICQLRF